MGRTYAISDVHGMGHLLDQMLEKIAFSEADRLYVLGDLIDRDLTRQVCWIWQWNGKISLH